MRVLEAFLVLATIAAYAAILWGISEMAGTPLAFAAMGAVWLLVPGQVKR